MINSDFSQQEMINVIKRIEQELSRWNYYESINGKSAVASMFFVFLKFIEDTHPVKCDGSIEVTIIEEMRRLLIQHESISNSLMYKYIRLHVETWNDDGNIILQYIQRIDFEKLPHEFLNVINILRDYAFETKEAKENLVYAILTLKSSLYGKQSFKSNGDLEVIIGASSVLGSNDGMEIYDFSCGTGSLLALSATTDCTIYGQERDFDKAVIAYMLLRITGVNTIQIEVGDVLQNPMTLNYQGKLFDRIISAPPLDYKEVSGEKFSNSKFSDEFLYKESFPESGLWIYARHIVKKLKNDGRGVLIAPVSLLSREGVTRDDRVRLAQQGYIEAIVQLPSIVTTGIKLCMIILRNGCEYNDYKIQLIDMNERQVEGEMKKTFDHKKMVEIINNKQAIDGVSTFVSLFDMEESGMNFTPAIYLRKIDEIVFQKENLFDILQRQNELFDQYRITEEELQKALINYYQLLGNKDKQEGN